MSSLPRSKSPSPASIDAFTKDQLKGLKTKLLAAKRDVEHLPITRLKETLDKILDFLEMCKKAKGNKEPIEQFVALGTRFVDQVLEPILKEKRLGEVEITSVLADRIHVLLRELSEAIPTKRQLTPSAFDRMFQLVDVTSALATVNSKVDGALQKFLGRGNIQCEVRSSDGRRVLRREQTPPSAEEPAQDIEANQRLLPPDAPSPPVTDQENLQSTVHSVLDDLPKFRILLLGKSGVGKSSLINNIFRIPIAEVAHFRAGGANINEEITSDSNPHFILHDSIGFESGSLEQFKTVENFIKERSQKAEVSERIHAIWLCTTVPVSGSRVFEVGDERLFQMDLGGVPLIVVFTKYDALVSKTVLEYVEAAMIDDEEELRRTGREAAEKEFDRVCVQPLQNICHKWKRPEVPPHLKVSVNVGYEHTLSQLVQLTRKSVTNVVEEPEEQQPATSTQSKEERKDETVWLTWAIAQRADADTSVEASIAIGRKKFWRGLGSSFYFHEKSLKRCLDVLHEDIVLVWNFYDPHRYLVDEDFKQRMRASIEDLADKDAVNPNTALVTGISATAGVTGLVGALIPPGALIVGPIGAIAVLAKWVYDVYQQTPGVLRCLMAYIVDLTIVMRRLFWNVRKEGGIKPLPEALLLQSLKEFADSDDRRLVHGEIRSFVDKGGIKDRVSKDRVMDEVVRLIDKYRFDFDPAAVGAQ
ncbi:hypothetical protein FRC02_006724 [Tulasnella sp. 418]|nr:hypothetical protein FRC02_006724 [Tulasnella sp. 418]